MTSEQSGSFSIMTYNLQAHEEELDSLLKVIREMNADIVGLQELSDEIGKRLAQEFSERYPHQALHPKEGYATKGQGILSRYPIEEDHFWMLHMGNQRVQLNIDGQRLLVYNVHPAAPVSDGVEGRQEDIDKILERCQNETEPLIILGDFNMTPDSEDYKQMTERFVDVFDEIGKGSGNTFPDAVGDIPIISWLMQPVSRYDYIFRSQHLQSISIEVWPDSGGSDHRPVMAWMRLA